MYRDDDDELGWWDELRYAARVGGMLATAFMSEATDAAWDAMDDDEGREPEDERDEDDVAVPEGDEFDELDEGDVFNLMQDEEE